MGIHLVLEGLWLWTCRPRESHRASRQAGEEPQRVTTGEGTANLNGLALQVAAGEHAGPVPPDFGFALAVTRVFRDRQAHEEV